MNFISLTSLEAIAGEPYFGKLTHSEDCEDCKDCSLIGDPLILEAGYCILQWAIPAYTKVDGKNFLARVADSNELCPRADVEANRASSA